MSSKISIFLTKDHEHCYLDTNKRVYENGKLVGWELTLELSKKNVKIVCNDEIDLILEIAPGSEIYYLLSKLIK